LQGGLAVPGLGPVPRPGARDLDEVWRTFEAPAPSIDGYRVMWVHAGGKAARDGVTRPAD